MKKVLLLMVLLFGLAAVAAPVQASMVRFELDTNFLGWMPPDPTETPPWIIAEFEDGATPGSVTLTLAGSFVTGYLDKWYLNLDPSFNPANLTFTRTNANLTPSPAAINKSANGFNVEGDGFYDIEFDWVGC